MPTELQTSAPQPANVSRAPASAEVGPVTRVSDLYLVYVLIFGSLVFLLYVLPEVMIFKQYGFAPVEHLDTKTSSSLREILSNLWIDRSQLLNPMNNPLVRFFLVTMIVGVVFDQVKKHSPSTRERS